jgi:hypothetical protein
VQAAPCATNVQLGALTRALCRGVTVRGDASDSKPHGKVFDSSSAKR